MSLLEQTAKRLTFAIISHPDAGKTTLTEKLLLFGGAIQMAGTIKGRKAARHATSDWMALEQQRGISVTSSVMQFIYRNRVLNLLDTPGHEDFSEDTYRTLTAVDSALMVIDAARGVEPRTLKLWEVCQLRNTPAVTFVNKLDRDSREPLDLLDEIESTLKIRCTPVTWPLGSGKLFKGIYHLLDDKFIVYAHRGEEPPPPIVGINNPELDKLLGEDAKRLREEIELVKGASNEFNQEEYLRGELTPVCFGTALNDCGVQELLDTFVAYAPSPLPRAATDREVQPSETPFSGFVFKIQANMDPAHRDRIAFMRIVSGQFTKGMKLYSVRLDREIAINHSLTFMAQSREQVEEAWPGDIIGVYNHGTIQIGDTLTQGEKLKFTGIPYFAPEMFRLVRLKDPLKSKALLKGLLQLCEEGATQVFRPLNSNNLILGAVGMLQFDVVAYRLKHEYNVDCIYENVQVATARWIECEDKKRLEEFKNKAFDNLALDEGENLAYLAPTFVNLNLTKDRWPEVEFKATREHGG